MDLLKRGIQGIDSTTPHVNIFKLMTWRFSSSKYISSTDVLGIGHVILNSGDINSRHGTQVLANAILKAKRRVKHHGTVLFRDRVDQPFGYTIFMMHIDTTIEKTLVMLTNVLNKKWLLDVTFPIYRPETLAPGCNVYGLYFGNVTSRSHFFFSTFVSITNVFYIVV